MDLKLGGKRAFVSGSSSGIGAATARFLAAEGAHVVVHGRDPERTEAVAQDIRARGGHAVVALGDLSTEQGTTEAAEAAIRELGNIDILINNAGGSEDPSLTWDTTLWDTWLEDYEKNVGSAVRLIGHFLPSMKENGWGRIIQVASASALMPFAHTTPAYNAAKASLLPLTVSLSKTVARHGITVNTVTPGPVDSAVFREFVMNLPPYRGKSFEEIEPVAAKRWNVPVNRFGRPDDLAAMLTFLCSPLASFVTGANIRVDGGMCGFINA